MRHTAAWTILAAFLLFLTTGCATTGQRINLLSTQEEVQLGQEFSQEVEQNEKLLDDAAVQQYVREIGGRLAAVSPRHDVQYTFKVIDAPDTVNAFALPGGYMYIYTGLMKLCESEAELAGVMAHEMAHVAAHHHGEMLTRQLGFNILASMALGQNPSQVAQTTAALFMGGVSAAYSRDQEREADGLGMAILFRAGYRPDAMVTFMYKLRELDREKGQGGVPIFSSHPPTTERVARLQHQVQTYPVELRMQRPLGSQRYYDEALSRLD